MNSKDFFCENARGVFVEVHLCGRFKCPNYALLPAKQFRAKNVGATGAVELTRISDTMDIFHTQVSLS